MAKVKAPKPTKYGKGDRIHAPGRIGEITCVIRGRKTKYEVLWTGKRLSTYTEYELEVIAYKIEKVQANSTPVEAETVQADLLNFPREREFEVGDRVLLKNTKLQGTVTDLNGLIHWDDGTTTTSTLSTTYLKKCSPSETTAQASELDSHLQQLNLEDLISENSVKSTNTAVISSPSDIQEFQSNETSKPWTAHGKQSRLSQVRPHAPRSQSKVKGSEPRTKEIVSRRSSKKLQQLALDFSQSKMSEASSLAHGDQATEREPTSTIFSVTFPAAGMTSNGKWSAADTLNPPSLESGCFWLESPGALSSTGRSPGLTRLESDLVNQQILETGQVLNPIFLEDAFTIPMGWSDPLECRAATVLLAEEEKRSEIASTPELPESPLKESSTSTQLFKTEAELEERSPDSLEKPEAQPSKQTGSLYQYTANKTDKLGIIHTYPKVEGDRKREEDNHWYWGYSYVEKEQGKWRDKSASIPRKKLSAVRAALRNGKTYTYILQEILEK